MMALISDSAAVGTLFEAKRMKLLMTQLPPPSGGGGGEEVKVVVVKWQQQLLLPSCTWEVENRHNTSEHIVRARHTSRTFTCRPHLMQHITELFTASVPF